MNTDIGKRSLIAAVVLAALGLVGAQTAMWMAYHYAPTQISSGSLFVDIAPAEGADATLYESYRIFFTHLPCAYATAACCGFMLVGGVMWLLLRTPLWDHLTVASAEVGLVAGGCTLVTGSIWAKFAWGSYWNWEPRLTTMLILWLAFAAMLALRASMPPGTKRGMLTAVYGILASPLYPLVHAAINIGSGLHPKGFSFLHSAPAIDTTAQVAELGIIPVFLAMLMARLMWRQVQQGLEVERASMKIVVIIFVVLLAGPLAADTRGANLPPPPVTQEQRDALLKEFTDVAQPKIEERLRSELEAEYRKKLEQRVAEERENYAGSINNLWMSNAAVWGVLGLFIILQAFSARKRLSELARLKAERQVKP